MSEPTSETTNKPDIKPSPPKSHVEPTLKAQKIASLQKRNAEIEAEIVATKSQLEEVRKDLKHPPHETVRAHIAHLHAYNEIRDVGQGLIGLVADGRNVRAAEVYEEFGVSDKD